MAAVFEDDFPITMGGERYSSTIRTTGCHLLVHGTKCESCQDYRPLLRAMHSRWTRRSTEVQKHGNNRYLSTPQKGEKLRNLQVRASSAEKEVQKLREKIRKSTEKRGIHVDSQLHDELTSTMEQNDDQIRKDFPPGTFRHLFWEQQLKTARCSNPRQMRWHPCMVRWCLNLKLLSSAAYHALGTSGFVKLPSERTLRDYTHFIKSRSGFYDELDQLLADEAKLRTLPDWKKHVVVVFDEMKLKESLVYDKNENQVIGFVDLGELNNDLVRLEQSEGDQHPPVATHMLALMVRGIFTNLRFPYAQFPTANTNADFLFTIIWEAVERLEFLGFKVMVVTGDGAAPNRKFFRMHSSSKDTLCYKTKNPYTDENRFLFFMSDVPHLLKTTRNCWSHSFGHGRTRTLWVSLCAHACCTCMCMLHLHGSSWNETIKPNSAGGVCIR